MVVGERGMRLTLLGVGTLHMLRSSALLVLLLLLVVRSALDISACQTFSTASVLPLPPSLHLSVCVRGSVQGGEQHSTLSRVCGTVGQFHVT